VRAWPKSKIGDLLARVKDDVLIDDLATYGRITIRMSGKGVLLRDRVTGAEIGTKRQFVARSGQFVLSKIDARNGAFGVLPPECDKAIVTGNFWVFDVDRAQLDPRFFNYLSKSSAFVAACVGASDGTTNRRYLQEDLFLRMLVPSPPLAEQQIVVARLDALVDKTHQLTAHLDAIEADADRLLAQQFRDTIANAPHRPLAEVAPLVRRGVVIDPDASYTELGVRSFYKGTFHRRTVPGSEFTWQKMFRIESDDLIFSNIMAWEQAIALAKLEDHGCVGNHRMLTCLADKKQVLPAFLAYYFTTEEGFAKVYAASPGTAARNRTLVAGNLEAITVPIPSLSAQQAFVDLKATVSALKTRQGAIREASVALLPATLERLFVAEDRSP
jgi:type I restriction enzyme S subunit